MAKEERKQFVRYLMVALFVAGKVHGRPTPSGTTPGTVTVLPRIDGSNESATDEPTASVTGDEIILLDSTTPGTGTTHDRVLFTDTPVMDVITLIWYLATFVALISFFLVMACADRNRCRSRKPAAEELTPPPTPAPSYRQFAPPSYDSLGFEKDNDSIYIIPYDGRIDDDVHRNAEDLASNLEYIIEPSGQQQPSSHRVSISDINTSGDEEAPVCVAVPRGSVQPGDDTAEPCYVTVL